YPAFVDAGARSATTAHRRPVFGKSAATERAVALQEGDLRAAGGSFKRERAGTGAARVRRRTGTKTVTCREPSARRSRAGSPTHTAAQRTAGLSEFRPSPGQHTRL